MADFHALRHTFITCLTRAGVMPAMAMKLARHKSIAVTMEYYTHVLITDERTALSKLPPLAKMRSRDDKGGTATSAA